MEWIQKGSKGDDVLTVQKKLQAKGFDPGPIDGIFGSKTESAVRRFQEKNNLQVDGIVGPKTGGALGMLEKKAPSKPMMPTQDPGRAKRKEAEAKKAKEAAKKGAEANKALRAAEKEAADKAKAVEAMKAGAEKQLEDEKIGGSLWSRVFGKSRKRDR